MMECRWKFVVVILVINVLFFLALGVFLAHWISARFNDTSSILQSLKLTNDQVAHSNKTIALLKSDIQKLKIACTQERSSHSELIQLLNEAASPASASKQIGEDKKSTHRYISRNRSDASIVYYGVEVQGCDWSIGMIALNNFVVVILTLIIQHILKVTCCKGGSLLKSHIKNTTCGFNRETDSEATSHHPNTLVL